MDVSDLNPEQIDTVQQFARALRTIQARAGLSLRQLEKNADVSKSTLSLMLKGERLPTKRTVEVFLRACGLGEEQAEPWLRTRGHLESGWPTPDSSDEPGGSEAPRPSSALADDQQSRDRRPRITVYAVVAVAVLGAAGIWGAIHFGSTSAPPPGGEACREGYQPVVRAGVAIKPCIELSQGKVRMNVYIKALQPAGTSGEVTAYVWLTHRDSKDKYRQSLHSCPVALPDDQKVTTCANTFTPPEPGHYYTAASAQTGTDPLPPEWTPQYTGTQSPTLRWQP
ncbi:helix-turn-helix transcriptional regulator [Nonomuraea sp. NPDC005983]|uniref:helix-turn-helix domain-containing protein n=1 Tax=Nonomuraea sp. NPDC005983 TaxID=3155595 RepID=UPI0033B3838C